MLIGSITKITEYPPNKIKGICQGFGSKENTGKGDNCKSKYQLAQFCQRRKKGVLPYYIIFVNGIPSHQKNRDVSQGMETSPKYKGPIGPVPKSAHQKYDTDISYCPSLTHARPSQRDINIVPKPSG